MPFANLMTARNTTRIAGAVVAAVLWIIIPPQYALFADIFIFSATFEIDVRIIGGLALLSLILIPIAIFFSKDLASRIAVDAFLLLCITVILQLISYARNARQRPAQGLRLEPTPQVPRLDTGPQEGVQIPRFEKVSAPLAHGQFVVDLKKKVQAAIERPRAAFSKPDTSLERQRLDGIILRRRV